MRKRKAKKRVKATLPKPEITGNYSLTFKDVFVCGFITVIVLGPYFFLAWFSASSN